MPVVYEENRAVFTEICTVEEADAFLAWLRDTPAAQVDLRHCQHFHTALLQMFMAFAPVIVAPPEDPFLNQVVQLMSTAGKTS